MAEIDDSRKGVASKDSNKLKLLGNFKGLRELCRLHCATQVKEGCGKVIIPSNSVGFYECLQNPPDSASPPKKQSSYKRSHDDVVSDSDAEIETVKVLKSTQMPRNAHPIQCPVCGEEILVASDITLPYWRSLKSKRSKSSQEQVQEGTSKEGIRRHCKKSGHQMIWEVATREDYVSDQSLRNNASTEGVAWVLVHTFLSQSFFPNFNDLRTNGELGFFVALVQWRTAVEAKGT
jgi:hypothetical protein